MDFHIDRRSSETGSSCVSCKSPCELLETGYDPDTSARVFRERTDTLYLGVRKLALHGLFVKANI